MIDLFISEKILTVRDIGGDDFKRLNRLIDIKIPDRIGKNNRWLYIYTAKILRSKIFPDVDLSKFTNSKNNIWNSKYATSKALRRRDEYEKKMITLLEMNAVNSWEDFKRFLEFLK